MNTKGPRIKIPYLLKDDKENVLENLLEGYMLVFRFLKLEEMVNYGDQITSTLKQLFAYYAGMYIYIYYVTYIQYTCSCAIEI